MPIQQIKTHNKLLCICNDHEEFYIGDFDGNIIKLECGTYNKADILFKTEGNPISAIKSKSMKESGLMINQNKHNNKSSKEVPNNIKLKEHDDDLCEQEIVIIFAGTWKGILYKIEYNKDTKKMLKIDKTMLIQNEMIKSLEIVNNNVFVSCGVFIYKISIDNFQVLDTYDIKYKALSMALHNQNLYLGLNTGILLVIKNIDSCKNSIVESLGSFHETSIFGITVISNKLVTCSADKSIKMEKEDKPLFISQKDWIRCISANIAGCGNDVLSIDLDSKSHVKKIASHHDAVSGVCIYEDIIISIGLDGVISIIKKEIDIYSDEERELEAMMK